jgi:hypothetical protein
LPFDFLFNHGYIEEIILKCLHYKRDEEVAIKKKQIATRVNPVASALVSARVGPEILEALKKAAAADDRTVSALVQRVLKAWLKEQGFLN